MGARGGGGRGNFRGRGRGGMHAGGGPPLQPIIADVSLDVGATHDLLAQQLVHVLRENTEKTVGISNRFILISFVI